MTHPWTQETDAIEKATRRALIAIGALLVGDAGLRVPVDTGRLRGSITYAVKGGRSNTKSPAKGTDAVSTPADSTVCYVGTNVEYAQHIEYGTRRSAAQPYLRPAFDSNRKNIAKIQRDELKAAFRGKR